MTFAWPYTFTLYIIHTYYVETDFTKYKRRQKINSDCIFMEANEHDMGETRETPQEFYLQRAFARHCIKC